MSFRKVFATSVLTFLLNGRLNQIMFRFLCLFFLLFLFTLFSWHLYSSFVLYSDFDKASSYPPFTELNISSLDEFHENHFLIEFGNCFNIPGGWFEEVWIYDILSLGFLYGRYASSDKLNVTSKMSTSVRFVWIWILKPTDLKHWVIFLRIWSICFPFNLCRTNKPPSRYKPISF